jgi:hypothetical protein
MIPAIALRHPDHFLAVGDVATKFLAGIAEKRLGFFIDDRACTAGRRIDLDHAVDLVSALVVLKRQRRTVLPPLQAAEVVGVRKQGVVDDMDALVDHTDDDGPLDVQHVARLGILHR